MCTEQNVNLMDNLADQKKTIEYKKVKIYL